MRNKSWIEALIDSFVFRYFQIQLVNKIICMGNKIQNDQLHFGMAMVRHFLLLLRQDRMGMGDYLSVFQFMGMKKQYTIGQDTQHQCQAQVTE